MLTDIYNYLELDEFTATSGQPSQAQIAEIAAAGYQVVINLALASSDNALPDEAATVRAHGMHYVHIPVVWTQPTLDGLHAFFAAMQQRQGQKLFVHCAANMRVSAFMALYRIKRLGWPPQEAFEDLHRIWEPEGVWKDFVEQALQMNMSYIAWLRERVGHRRVIMVFATVVLYDERGRVLLQRRTDFDIWGLPGGILEPGESIQTCARRELLEETGLTAGDLRLVGVYADPRYDSTYPNGDQVQQYTVCFAAPANGGQMQPDGEETSAQAFFAPGEIPYHELPPWYQDMLRDALRGGGPYYALPACRPEPVDNITLLRAHVGQALIVAPGAIAVVVDEQGRVLMGRRSDDGGWSLPGGYMHLGENDAYTALRETREETGLEVTIERMLGVYSPETVWTYPNGDQVQAVISCFLARPTGGQLRPDGSETSQVTWMRLVEILALDAPPALARLHYHIAEQLCSDSRGPGQDSGVIFSF